MGTLRQVAQSNAIQNATVTTTTETVVGLVTVPTNMRPGGTVKIRANVAHTTGTGVTACVLRVYRGATASGTLVDVARTTQIGASLATDLSIQVTDSPTGELASQPYCVTLQQTGATGNGTVAGVDVVAEAEY